MNAAGGPDRAARGQSFSPLPAEQARAAACTTGDTQALTFPDLPRLELDQLLGQLVERAQEVMGTQGRLRGSAAGQPGDHRGSGAAGGAAPDRRGGPRAGRCPLRGAGGDRARRRTGRVRARRHARRGGGADRAPPAGQGTAGALIEDPRPIRLARIADDPRSSGFPPGHPPMAASWACRSGSATRCSATSTSPRAPGASSAPRTSELATALAATAGMAIDNARLYEAARSRGEWLQATAAITRRLLSADPTPADPLQLIAARSREIADADLVTVVLPADADGATDLRVEVAIGVGAEDLPGLPVPLQGSLSGRVFTTGQPLRVAHPRDEAGLASVASGALDVGPVLVVPLRGSTRVHGVLSVARLPRPARVHRRRPGDGRRVRQPGRGRDRARRGPRRAAARRDARRARADRRGPARPRHPTAVRHRAVAAERWPPPSARAGPPTGSWPPIADLDDTISQIRTSIFALQQTPADPPSRPAGPPARRRHRGDPRARVRPRPSGSPGCSTPCPTTSPRTCWPCSARR